MPFESLAGSTIAGFHLVARVGEGGTSTVYRAEHPVHGTVAMKVLREKLRQDRTAVERFLREARFGQRVQHPNIVRTIAYGEDPPGRHYLAIDWADGELLEKYAERKGVVPAPLVAEIVGQLADAVQAVHDEGIVHRDLKPENVMYDPVTHHVMLLDFGIAADTETAPEQRLTRAGFFVGTLMYVAPEALSGELVGPAADQYSIATIAYFLLTGALPYSGKSPRDLFSQLLTQPPTPLNSARPALRFAPAVERTIMRALSRAPGDRFPSTGDFAAALRDSALHPVPEHISSPSARSSSVAEENAAGEKSSGIMGSLRSLFGKRGGSN
jgi:serine/threonine protein kinase